MPPGKLAKLGDMKRIPYAGADEVSTYDEASSYVLYREFGDRSEAAIERAPAIRTRPWTVAVEGEVLKPRLFDIEDLLRLAPLEERVYRHRCVANWFKVVPWVGFPLAELAKRVEPTGNAKYVEFTSVFDPKIMLPAKGEFPYVEGLRMDEALHPLTLLTFGMYGEILPNANGAPVRLVVPWKHAHKSVKAIVRIRFVAQQPRAHYHTLYPETYGFYRNVHPDLRENRSQKRERRLDELIASRPTPLMNGYADQVAHLYGSELHTLR
jgi:sulfoxide reductase catalytic subunit YedY